MRDLIDQLQREERARLVLTPAHTAGRPTIHYTELPEDTTSSALATEWNYYRGEVGRLLAEGHEGQWVLIKGQKIIGLWDTELEADEVRLRQFPGRPVLLKQIREREPVIRGGGYQYGWRR
jgi:hypothetical protein